MYRLYFYLLAFTSVMAVPVLGFAETAAGPATGDKQSHNRAHIANDGGFYTALPAVDNRQLIDLLRLYRVALEQREGEVSRYLEENQLDTKDMLITVIMPGGLVYAAVRKANLEEARDELTEITEDMDELSRDLLAMQVEAGELTLARLQ